MKHIVLIGDSVFDNGAYVLPGEPDVVAQVRSRLPSDWSASLRARDGAKIRDVIEQVRDLPGDASHLVVSAGGNDALQHANLLSESAGSVSEVLHRLADIKRRFQDEYRAMLDAVESSNLSSTVCTIYRGNFDDPEMQNLADVGSSIFNDVITSEAWSREMPIIDLRVIFNCREDYANPIEPSARGGEKLARAIVDVVVPLGMRLR